MSKTESRAGISEITIVDTFTRLIFGEGTDLDPGELHIVQALRLVDSNVSVSALEDLGRYLRALEVSEMIELVGRVQSAIESGIPAARGAGHKGQGARPGY